MLIVNSIFNLLLKKTTLNEVSKNETVSEFDIAAIEVSPELSNLYCEIFDRSNEQKPNGRHLG